MLDLSLFVQTHSAAPAIRIQTQADLAAFWHGTFDSPCIYTLPQYGQHTHDVLPDPPSLPLTPAELNELQEIVGVFLFYDAHTFE